MHAAPLNCHAVQEDCPADAVTCLCDGNEVPIEIHMHEGPAGWVGQCPMCGKIFSKRRGK